MMASQCIIAGYCAQCQALIWKATDMCVIIWRLILSYPSHHSFSCRSSLCLPPVWWILSALVSFLDCSPKHVYFLALRTWDSCVCSRTTLLRHFLNRLTTFLTKPCSNHGWNIVTRRVCTYVCCSSPHSRLVWEGEANSRSSLSVNEAVSPSLNKHRCTECVQLITTYYFQDTMCGMTNLYTRKHMHNGACMIFLV